MMDQGIDRTFHGSTANGIAFLAETGIINFRETVLKVGRGLANPPVPMQTMQSRNDFIAASMPEMLDLVFCPSLGLGGAFAKSSFRHFPQAFIRLPPIQNLQGVGIVVGGDALDPYGAIVG
jgi:hypothetical protein